MALIRSIPYAQYLRIGRNCTHLDEFKIQANLLRDHLRARGYSKSILRSAYIKDLRQPRNSLLYKTKQLMIDLQLIILPDTPHTIKNYTTFWQDIGHCCMLIPSSPNMSVLYLLSLLEDQGLWETNLHSADIWVMYYPDASRMALPDVADVSFAPRSLQAKGSCSLMVRFSFPLFMKIVRHRALFIWCLVDAMLFMLAKLPDNFTLGSKITFIIPKMVTWSLQSVDT